MIFSSRYLFAVVGRKAKVELGRPEMIKRPSFATVEIQLDSARHLLRASQ